MDAQGRGGIRPVEAVVLAFLFLIAVTFAASCRTTTGRVSRQVVCASHLRQFGVAFVNYAVQHGGLMPPGDRNIWWCLVPYVGEVPLVSEGNAVGTANELFRCPSDRLNADGLAGTSYGFNCTTFLTVGQARANRDNSPFGAAEFVTEDGDPMRKEAKYYSGSPADTYLMIEYWGPDAYHNRPDDTYHLLMLDEPDSPAKHLLRAPEGVDDPWTVKDAARFAAAGGDRVALPVEMAHEWVANFVDKRFDSTFHAGRINVLTADGAGFPVDVRQQATTPPGNDPRWTALPD